MSFGDQQKSYQTGKESKLSYQTGKESKLSQVESKMSKKTYETGKTEKSKIDSLYINVPSSTKQESVPFITADRMKLNNKKEIKQKIIKFARSVEGMGMERGFKS